MVDNMRGMAPSHPGALLRDIVLPALKVSKTQAARDLKISRNLLYGILTEKKAVTPETAVKLGKYCGNGPDLWLRMQVAYDLYHAKKKMAKIVRQIPDVSAAVPTPA